MYRSYKSDFCNYNNNLLLRCLIKEIWQLGLPLSLSPKNCQFLGNSINQYDITEMALIIICFVSVPIALKLQFHKILPPYELVKDQDV